MKKGGSDDPPFFIWLSRKLAAAVIGRDESRWSDHRRR
jgi:hypothetical protein